MRCKEARRQAANIKHYSHPQTKTEGKITKEYNRQKGNTTNLPLRLKRKTTDQNFKNRRKITQSKADVNQVKNVFLNQLRVFVAIVFFAQLSASETIEKAKDFVKLRKPSTLLSERDESNAEDRYEPVVDGQHTESLEMKFSQMHDMFAICKRLLLRRKQQLRRNLRSEHNRMCYR